MANLRCASMQALLTLSVALCVDGLSNSKNADSLRPSAFLNSVIPAKGIARHDICRLRWRPPAEAQQKFGPSNLRRSAVGVCSVNAIAEGLSAAAHLSVLLSAVDTTTLTAMFPDAHQLLADAAAAVGDAASAAPASTAAIAAPAATVAPDAADAAAKAASPGIFDSFVNVIEQSLILLHSTLKTGNVPGAWGLSIIFFTVLIKVLTFPLNYKQMVSTIQMQNLQPKIKALQSRYQNDPQTLNAMTSKMYQDEKVNPLAGCLPTLVQIPIFIALYRSLLDLAKKDVLGESFLWIPSLEGPVGEYNLKTGLPVDGTAWLFKGWVDGHPAMGWEATLAYLSIPIILVITQSLSQKVLQPPPSDDPAAQQTQMILKFLPLMIGWFSLNVPAGLGVYWVINNVLSTGQQFYIRQKVKAEMPAAAPVQTETVRDQLRSSSATAQKPADDIKFKVMKRSTATLTTPPPKAPKPAEDTAPPVPAAAIITPPPPALADATVAAAAAATVAKPAEAAKDDSPEGKGDSEPSKTALKKKAKAAKSKKK